MLEVNPTLIIGLGGSGKEIILRLRRRFFEAGYFAQPAWISYLWIDTAVSSEKTRYLTERYGVEHPFDYIAACTALKTDEMCDIGLSSSEIDAIHHPDTMSAHQHIWEWIDPTVFNSINARGLASGTHQLPMLGRLGLFGRAPNVCENFATALRRLAQTNVIQNIESALHSGDMPSPASGQQFEVYNECQAFIVGSLAGGTGSGICVDVAAMLKSARELFQFNTRLAVWGHFLLPGAFLRGSTVTASPNFDAERVRANSRDVLQAIERMSNSRTGSMKATWLHPEFPDRAPDVRAPIFDSVALYDDRCRSDELEFAHIGDCYAQIAHLLFNETRIKPSEIPGLPHFAWVTSQHKAFEQNHTTELNSMRFMAAGLARATFELPRLRIMAALTLALEALQQWMGEPIPRFQFDSNVPLTKTEAQSEALRNCVEARLEQEFSHFVSNKKTRWRDVLPEENVCVLISTLRQSNSVPDSPDFFDRYFKLADAWPVQWDPAHIGERLLKYYFTGPSPRIDKVLRDLIDTPPLAGWDTTDVDGSYNRPGGLWTVDYVLDYGLDDKRQTVIETAIAKCVSQLGKKATALLLHNNETREKLNIMATEFASSADAYKQSKNQFWVSKSSKEEIAAMRFQRYFKLHQAMLKWLVNVEKQKVCEALKLGYESMLRSASPIKTMLKKWRKRTRSLRTLILKLIQNPDASQSNGEFGLAQILTQFRLLKPDASTLQQRPDIQQDALVLSSEILAAYNGNATAQAESVLAIQHGMLSVWNNFLSGAGSVNESPLAKRSQHLTDLPDTKAFEQIPFGVQIDQFLKLGLAQEGARNLLTNISMRGVMLGDRKLAEKLHSMSECHLELSPNLTKRAPALVEAAGSCDSGERVVFIGPSRTLTPPGIASVESDNPHEATCFRYEYFVPLSRVVAAKS